MMKNHENETAFDVACELLSPERRQFLLAVAMGAATIALGRVMGAVGIKSAWADCFCRNTAYDPNVDCCMPGGFLLPREMDDPNMYQDKVHRDGYNCVPNGCGAEGGVSGIDSIFGVDLTPCCDSHDCCWADCRGNRKRCDNDLNSCLRSQCRQLSGGERSVCMGVARAYTDAVRSGFGTENYNSSIRQACVGCGVAACGRESGNGCGSGCADGCTCDDTTDGQQCSQWRRINGEPREFKGGFIDGRDAFHFYCEGARRGCDSSSDCARRGFANNLCTRYVNTHDMPDGCSHEMWVCFPVCPV